MHRIGAITLAVMVAITVWLPNAAHATTTVGGVLQSDTMWTTDNGPYIVTSTVQIPEGVTLTIEPGAVVEASSGLADMFLVHGTLRAIGTSSNKITFDGAGSANFFSAKSSPETMLVHVEYADISNGRSLWPPTGYEQYGHLVLRHSNVSNLTYYSYIWYPQQDVYIEHNTFVNAQGFSIGTGSGLAEAANVKVYIRWNRFVKLADGYSAYPAWIVNWASYGSSQTLVNFNVFESMPPGKFALYLPSGYDPAAMDGTSNYWGTTDRSYVESKIFDRNDDITTAGIIPYDPLLSSAPSEVPPSPPATLSVARTGSGLGTVTSTPSGISCGEECSAAFPIGSSMTLTAHAEEGSEFVGWSGACSGVDTCMLSLGEGTSVSAAFALDHSNHHRAVSLNLRRHLIARGVVTTTGPGDCAERATVAIQRQVNRVWKRVRTTVAGESGGFRVGLRDTRGRYRAVAVARDLDAQNSCLEARSRVSRHHH